MVKSDGYYKSEVGRIPDTWKVATIKNSYEICNNLRFPISADKRKRMKGKYPYYGPTKIQDYINEYRLDGEYALIGEDGDHFLKWATNPMTTLAKGKFNVNNHAHVIKGKIGSTEWFYTYFCHRDITQVLSRQGAGRYKLNKATLEKLLIALPPIEEQKAISTALSDMDDLILSLEKLIGKKKMIMEGTMEKLFSSEKISSTYTYKTTRIMDICNLVKGQQFNKCDFNFNGKYYILNGGTSPSGFSELWNTKENTISISEGGESCGFVNFNKEKFWSGGHCYTIKNISSNINTIYFYYILKFNQRNIMKLRVGSGLPNIQKAALNDFNIEYIDSIEEQQAIASILSDMDEEIEKLEKKLDKYKNIKSGMMEELLTGKRRLV